MRPTNEHETASTDGAGGGSEKKRNIAPSIYTKKRGDISIVSLYAEWANCGKQKKHYGTRKLSTTKRIARARRGFPSSKKSAAFK